MKNTAGVVMQPKKRMYIVDQGASLHMMRLSLLNHREKKTIRQSINILDFQTTNGIVVAETQAKVYIKELGAHQWIRLVKDSPSVLSLGRRSNELRYAYSWPSRKTPKLKNVRK